MKRWTRPVATTVLLMSAAAGSWAKAGESEPPAEREPVVGVPTTPESARLVARLIVGGLLQPRYALPDDSVAAAEKAIARRFMEAAHQADGPGHELFERYLEEQFSQLGRAESHRLIPPEFGKEMAERALPLLPDARELVRNVGQDIRPLLPIKQQLKLAGDLMAASAAIDGFEETMKRWAAGKETEYSNPFQPKNELSRDEQGVSQAGQAARKQARSVADFRWSGVGEGYLEQFKKFYELDADQVATADSLLREFVQRETALREQSDWPRKVYMNRLWARMIGELANEESRVLQEVIFDQGDEIWQLERKLTDEFKRRLESIPTTAQRQRAEQKVARLMEAKGLAVTATRP